MFVCLCASTIYRTRFIFNPNKISYIMLDLVVLLLGHM